MSAIAGLTAFLVIWGGFEGAALHVLGMGKSLVR
jgi:hypothetical protein